MHSLSLEEQWLWVVLRSSGRATVISKEQRKELFKHLKKLLPKSCPILGMKLNYTREKGGKGRQDDSPSIDRIDNTQGYVVGNVHIISWKANRIKSNGTPEELIAVGGYIKYLLGTT